MNSLFDEYDTRARLSVGIILISPLLLTAYLQLEVIRKLTTTIIVALALLAISNLIVIYTRYLGKPSFSKKGIVENMLLPSDSTIDKLTKKRIYTKLASKDTSLQILLDECDNPNPSIHFRLACSSAYNLIKETNRNNSLIHKENILYGFSRNMYGVKKYGIILSFILFVLEFIQFYFSYNCDLTIASIEFFVSFIINIFYLLLWIFFVNKKIVKFCAENYAEQLIKAFDQ